MVESFANLRVSRQANQDTKMKRLLTGMTLALTMATPWNAAHPAPQRAPDARADPSENQAPDGVAERWNNYDAFQLFNSCKPMGAGVSWSGRGHEDMESNLTQLVEGRLRLARLLNTDPNWSSDWLFIHVEYEQPWVFVNLEFHKTVRDEATGHTDHAATYTLQHVGLGETNAGIRETVDVVLIVFLEAHLRANSAAC